MPSKRTNDAIARRYDTSIIKVNNHRYGRPANVTGLGPTMTHGQRCSLCNQSLTDHAIPETQARTASDPEKFVDTRPKNSTVYRRPYGTYDDCLTLYRVLRERGANYAIEETEKHAASKNANFEKERIAKALQKFDASNYKQLDQVFPDADKRKLFVAWKQKMLDMAGKKYGARTIKNARSILVEYRDKVTAKRDRSHIASHQAFLNRSFLEIDFLDHDLKARQTFRPGVQVMLGVLHVEETDVVYASQSGESKSVFFDAVIAQLGFRKCADALTRPLKNRHHAQSVVEEYEPQQVSHGYLTTCPQNVQDLASDWNCAAPKLIQEALNNGYQPMAMTEMWFDPSKSHGVYDDGETIPSCDTCKTGVPRMLCPL